jgi:hypothetical protein
MKAYRRYILSFRWLLNQNMSYDLEFSTQVTTAELKAIAYVPPY